MTAYRNATSKPNAASIAADLRRAARRRKGVAALLAMMFLIIFGSLTAAMAVASRGNMVTATTHMHVLRAQSAAETGLAIGIARLAEAADRFRLSESNVNDVMGWDVWRGNLTGYDTPIIVPAETGRQDLADPAGIVQALAEVHALDQNTVTGTTPTSPTIGNASSAVSVVTDYKPTHWLYTQVVAIEPGTGGNSGLAYQIAYAPLANGTDVRVIVRGYDYSYSKKRKGLAPEPVTRTVMQDFRLIKRVKSAINSPSRVLLGKNVSVRGNVGLRYDEIGFNNGDPGILRSDFRGLSSALDQKLNLFYNRVSTSDDDFDNRLRVDHPAESSALTQAADDYATATGDVVNPYEDATGDGAVDEFDIFIRHYDSNGDKRVSQSEFSSGASLIDADLFDLVDAGSPDRNRNGLYGFIDVDGNGRKNGSEVFVDVDVNGVALDQVLGYLDGYIDHKDRYVKVNGSLSFKVAADDWESERGNVRGKLQGAVRPFEGNAAMQFEVASRNQTSTPAGVFSGTRGEIAGIADGGTVDAQAASPTAVPSTTPSVSTLQADANLDGLPDNYSTAYFEKMPYNAPNFSDFYYRPVYRNIVFRNATIPAGNNALYINCWFIGATYIQATNDNTHPLWNEYGKLSMPGSSTTPAPANARSIYGDGVGETFYPTMLPPTAIPPAKMILMASTPMDKADIPSNQIPFVTGYGNLPAPLIVDGLRITDTKPLSNNIRFHDCLFVGSIVSDVPQNYTQIRNKVQFTGATRFHEQNPYSSSPSLNPDAADVESLLKSSMMLPNYSVDVGHFNSPNNQDVNLTGAIIAGIMDIRGNATVNGALIMTFDPEHGQFPLRDVLGNPIGNPANFNVSIGYFGDESGDSESFDPESLPLVGGVRIVGWDTNGDGLADVNSDQPQPVGSTAVPFNGYGRVMINFDPDMKLPNGIRMPLEYETLHETYREGTP